VTKSNLALIGESPTLPDPHVEAVQRDRHDLEAAGRIVRDLDRSLAALQAQQEATAARRTELEQLIAEVYRPLRAWELAPRGPCPEPDAAALAVVRDSRLELEVISEREKSIAAGLARLTSDRSAAADRAVGLQQRLDRSAALCIVVQKRDRITDRMRRAWVEWRGAVLESLALRDFAATAGLDDHPDVIEFAIAARDGRQRALNVSQRDIDAAADTFRSEQHALSGREERP